MGKKYESRLSTESWTLRDISDFRDGESSARIQIEIPKFQRGIVWDSNKIEKLVDSLFNRFPIGSLLAYEASGGGARRTYQLIDGLQRSNAIAKFTEAPLRYASPDHLFDEEVFAEISQALSLPLDDHFSSARELLGAWMKQVGSTDDSAGYMLTNLKKFLTGDDEQKMQAIRPIEESLEKALNAARRSVDEILNLNLPVLVFWGPEEFIPEIFERINSQGTKLSKYEILASSWIHATTKISNPDIRQAIVDKYRGWINEGFEVVEDVFNENEDIEEGNLYEYLFGLSKVVSKKFPTIFGHGEDSEDVAFQIFTVASGLPIAKMKDLPGHMLRDTADAINPEPLEKAVLDSCEAISGRLDAYIGIKGNNVESEPKLPHSQNQIISFITSMVASAYDLETGKLNNPKARDSILNALPGHYLADILKKTWKGSGDSRLFERTWYRDEDGKAHSANGYYREPISREHFKQVFSSWNGEQLEKSQKSRANLQKDMLTTLKFLYSGVITSLQDKREVFEIEHIYPVAYCSNIIASSDTDEGWPISAIGNLMYLPKQINRIKGKNLLEPELMKLRKKSALQDHEERDLQNYLLSPRLSDIVSDNVTSRKTFEAFCQLRSDIIFEKLCQNLGLRT